MKSYNKSAEQATAHVQSYRYCLSVKPVSRSARWQCGATVDTKSIINLDAFRIELWQATQSER